MKCALIVWAVVALMSCGRAALYAKPKHRGIYPVFAEAGQNWLEGIDLYAPGDGYDIFRYSPLVAVLFAPFSSLPGPVGSGLWRALNAGIYLYGMARWSRLVLPLSLTQSQRAILFLLVVPVSISSLVNGQSNALIIGLLLLGLAAVVEERWNAASWYVVLATMLKGYPIAVGLLLAAVYPRRFAPRLVAALAAALALPFLFQSPEYVASQYGPWIRLMQANERQSWHYDFWYRDLRLLCQVWLTPLSPRAYLTIQLGAAAGMAGLCMAGRWSGWPQRKLLTLLLALGCCWMTLLGPATESCTYILLAPSFAWAVIEAHQPPRSLPICVLVDAGLVLCSAPQLLLAFSNANAVHNLGPHPLAALLLLTALLTGLVRSAGFARIPWPWVHSGYCRRAVV
jgi:hypothetical protein